MGDLDDKCIVQAMPSQIGSSSDALLLPCREMIHKSGLPERLISSLPTYVLDLGCGRKPLVALELLTRMPQHKVCNLQIVAIDIDEAAVQRATQALSGIDHFHNAMTFVMDMEKLDGLLDNTFDFVMANFSLQMAVDVDAAIQATHRVLVEGGIFSFTVWHALSWMGLLSSAIEEEIDPNAVSSASRTARQGKTLFPSGEECLLAISKGRPWHKPDYVRQKLTQSGMFDNVYITELKAKHRFTHEDFLKHFGTQVLNVIMSTCQLSSGTSEQFRQALQRKFTKATPTEGEMLEVELRSFVVTARKTLSTKTERPPVPQTDQKNGLI